MNTQPTSWLFLLLAIALANAPFLRLIRATRVQPHWLDFFGWLSCYAIWMLMSQLLEPMLGRTSAKTWEVWAVSMAMFGVLAFPGVVWRHLLRK